MRSLALSLLLALPLIASFDSGLPVLAQDRQDPALSDYFPPPEE